MKQTEDPQLTIVTIDGDTPSTVEIPGSVEPAAPEAEQKKPTQTPPPNPPQKTRDGGFWKNVVKVIRILNPDGLASQFMRKQIVPITIIALFFVVYIANGFSYRHKLLKTAQLKDSLEKARIESLSSISRLTKHTRESQVTQKLRAKGDTLLKISNTPPIIVYDPE